MAIYHISAEIYVDITKKDVQ